MSYDSSRITYACWKCGELPCVCRREYRALEVTTLRCRDCPKTFLTLGDLQEHHLAAHEIPLTESETFTPTIRPPFAF